VVYYAEEDTLSHKQRCVQVRDILGDWYRAMRDGTAKNRYPGENPALDPEAVDRVIVTIMTGELLREAVRTSKVVPPFDALPQHSKLALAQELVRVFKGRVFHEGGIDG
jgi:hypothetical protein